MSNPYDSGDGSLQSPPRSPAKPVACPYVPGATFTAHQHQPSAPFGGYYSDCDSPSQEKLGRMGQLDWCLSHPPTLGTTILDNTCSFTVTSDIRTGEDCGAQIVGLDNGLVAKIYDPMFYSFQNQEFLDLKVDVAMTAESEYTIEAAISSELKAHPVQGSIMPTYHGSWSMKVTEDVGGEHMTWDVRLILIEHVPGVRMLDLDPDDLEPELKEDIMVKVIEADYDLRYAGVHHEDLSPRNIMISLSPESSDVSRLTLIDFGHSTVYRICFGGLPLDELRNPLFSWSSAQRWGSYGWLPSCSEERTCRLWEIFGDGRDGKYVKVERDTNNSSGRPLRQEVAFTGWSGQD